MNCSEISLNLIGLRLQQLSTFSIKTYTMKKNDSLVELKLPLKYCGGILYIMLSFVSMIDFRGTYNQVPKGYCKLYMVC